MAEATATWEAADALGEPILIRYDGLDADRHEIEMAALAESLRGLSRIIGVCGNLAAAGKFVQHKDALSVRVVVRPAQAHCFELVAALTWISENPLVSATIAGLTTTLIAYVFKRAAGQREEMKQLRGALDLAIKELGTRDQPVVDKLLSTIDKMADALRPAARQAVAPIGETAKTLTVGGTGSANRVTVGAAEKAAILSDVPVEVGDERDYRIVITELDMDAGTCKVALADEPENRYAGRITDPAFSSPNNRYVLAMAAREPLRVRAKATLRDGTIDRLFISDAP